MTSSDWKSGKFYQYRAVTRGGSRAAATSKMERFMIIVNGCKPLTIVTKHSILNVAAALDQSLVTYSMNMIASMLKYLYSVGLTCS